MWKGKEDPAPGGLKEAHATLCPVLNATETTTQRIHLRTPKSKGCQVDWRKTQNSGYYHLTVYNFFSVRTFQPECNAA